MTVWIIAEKMNRYRLLNQKVLDVSIDDKDEVDRNLLYYKAERFLYQEGKRRGLDVTILDAKEVSCVLDDCGEIALFVNGVKARKPDFVFPWTSAGTDIFSLALYKQLELMGIPMLNDSSSVMMAADKYTSLLYLSKEKLPIPKMMFVTQKKSYEVINQHFSFPLVLKTWPGTNGVGVMLVNDLPSLEDFISIIRKVDLLTNVLVQEYIAESRGRDIRVVVLDGKVVGMTERRALDGGFKSNFERKGEFRVIPEIEEVKQIALKAAASLHLNYAGIDILYDTDGYKICEVNSAPGFASLEKLGIQPAEVLYDWVLKKMQEK